MNGAERFRAKLREPYMRMRRYHDPEVQWLATVGTQLADDLDAMTAERDMWRDAAEIWAPPHILAAISLETL